MRLIERNLVLRLSDAFTFNPIEIANVASPDGRAAIPKPGGYYIFADHLGWGAPTSVKIKAKSYCERIISVTQDAMHIQMTRPPELGTTKPIYYLELEPDELVHIYCEGMDSYTLKTNISAGDTLLEVNKRDLSDSTLVYYAPVLKDGGFGSPFLVTDLLPRGVMHISGSFEVEYKKPQYRISALCSLSADTDGKLEFTLPQGFSPPVYCFRQGVPREVMPLKNWSA